jgi:GNAT superfamily N-acetyltransferase
MVVWYQDLARYFPPEEMRSERHFEWLIDNRPDIYRVEATESHLLLTLDYPDVTFIDYLYVYPAYRGSGVGTRVLQSLKAKGKAVLLEIEPEAPDDPESVRRRRFYDRQAFRQVESLSFCLPSPLTWTLTYLDVLCWAPAGAVVAAFAGPALVCATAPNATKVPAAPSSSALIQRRAKRRFIGGLLVMPCLLSRCRLSRGARSPRRNQPVRILERPFQDKGQPTGKTRCCRPRPA